MDRIIIMILGSQGSGKSLFGVKQLYEAYKKGLSCYCNFHVTFPHELLKFDDIINCRLHDAVVVIDECMLWGLDSRSHGSAEAKAITSSFLMQCRKRNVTLYLISQTQFQVDARCRRNSSYYIICTKYLYDESNKRLVEAIQQKNYKKNVPQVIKCEWIDLSSGDDRATYFYANKYFSLYRTDEIIMMQKIEKKEVGNCEA